MSSPQTAPAVPTFLTYPSVRELIRPVPGVEYLIVPAQEVNKVQQEGWTPLRMPIYFDIQGHPFTLMARGEPMPGVSPESCQPQVYSTSTGDDLIGYVRLSDVKGENEGPKQDRQAQSGSSNARAQEGKATKQ